MRHFLGRALRKVSRIIDGADAPIPKDISDAYVNWLCFANAGMLHRGNLYSFDYAIQHLPSEAPIIEIGSFCGLSTNLLTYYKGKNRKNNPLITCDKWHFEGAQNDRSIGNSTIGHLEYRSFVRDTYMRNVRFFSGHDLPSTIEMTSDDFFAAWRDSRKTSDIFGRGIQLGGPISFCYIDGNHSYEYIKRDFENCNEFLEEGGFILFDDSQDGSDWDVCRIITEIRASKKYDMVIKNPNYLFIKK